MNPTRAGTRIVRWAAPAQLFRRAIELEPHWWKPHHNLGLLYRDHDRPDQARLYLEESFVRAPLYHGALDALAHLHQHVLGEVGAGCFYYRLLQALAPAGSSGGAEAAARVETCEADMRGASLRQQLGDMAHARPGLIPDTPGLQSHI